MTKRMFVNFRSRVEIISSSSTLEWNMLEILIILCCALCVAAQECGVMSNSASLVQSGLATEREAFPWIVNIFTKYEGAVLYAGSGSLISDRHVLCAGNSVAYENYLGDTLELNPEQNYIAYGGKNVSLTLGSSHYKNMYEPGTLSIDEVSKIVLHPSFASTRPRVFNIALIFLLDAVPFSNFIKPVCLQTPNENKNNILGKTVFAVGYGVDHSGFISGYKKHIPMAVLDNSTCQKFYSDTLKRGKASKFFCARGNGIQTPCRFDKPLYIKIGDRWFLQAMSSTFKIFKNRACRPRAPVLYEDVSPLTNWIESEMNHDNLID